MQIAQYIIIISIVLCVCVVFPVIALLGRRNDSRQLREDEGFAKVASSLGLVQSSVSNNDDYAFYYDAFTLSADSPIWQTTTQPRIYINPHRQHGAELLVKGSYNLPSIKLEAKNNQTRIQHIWGNKVPMNSVQLEGNFNDFFSLSCERGQELIALQIISPNIMQDMIDTQIYYDVQTLGSAIMITTDIDKWDVSFAQKLLAHATTLDGLVRATQKVTQPRIDKV